MEMLRDLPLRTTFRGVLALTNMLQGLEFSRKHKNQGSMKQTNLFYKYVMDFLYASVYFLFLKFTFLNKRLQTMCWGDLDFMINVE